MGERFLVDTNIIIYFLKGEIPNDHEEKVTEIFAESFYISTITKIEVLGWHKLDADEKSKIEHFLNSASIFYVDKIIQNKSIEIRQANAIKTADAVIGATALVYDLTLVTRNEGDFKKINGLEIYNPFSEDDQNFESILPQEKF